MAFCINCGNQIPDGAKFCPGCGLPSASINKNVRRTVFDGTVHKCPNCGEIIGSFATICPSCGAELRGTKATSSIREFSSELSEADSDNQKISIIRSYPIPNNKEDILEFLLLASSNITGEQDKAVFDAWLVKIDQSYKKAKLVITDNSDLDKIEGIYAQVLRQVKKERRKQKRNMKASEQTPSNSRGAVSLIASLVGRNLAVIGGIILFLVAALSGENETVAVPCILLGGILLIVSAITLVKRSTSYADIAIGAASGALSLFFVRYFEETKGSALILTGVVVILIVVVNFFVKAFRKDTKAQDTKDRQNAGFNQGFGGYQYTGTYQNPVQQNTGSYQSINGPLKMDDHQNMDNSPNSYNQKAIDAQENPIETKNITRKFNSSYDDAVASISGAFSSINDVFSSINPLRGGKNFPSKAETSAYLTEIKIPSRVRNGSIDNYAVAESMFTQAGFTNVRVIPLHDLTIGIMNKPGQIESITIDGKNLSSYFRTKFVSNVPIIISYSNFAGIKQTKSR